ncbi:hypothetical protein [cf. Phormidesmis sp. LEGE 11477]|uniref:hypothetical protein n=1 Tax=cf. Phormidesmis sp. LEGE 11477 TaxID=1828680 RepID=UPI00187E1D94|nr:hypothetical protein [cf. Phormidesmis sp. LEGE 11477]MBE9063585.1 hypothetical protein [cf. Phormidesmis sp. LEGE 11477]
MNSPHTQQSKQPAGSSVDLATDLASDVGAQPQPAALPPILLVLVLVSIVLLIIVGTALFCFPGFSQSRWLWPLKPFNTRFLGAIYLTALVGLASLVLSRRAALTRLIVPMMWVFTTVVLMVSCLQLQQFSPGRRATDIWFLLYLVDCVGASYYWGYFKPYNYLGLRRLPNLWPTVLGIQSGILGAYGLSLLFTPAAAGGAWLWPLDVFHAQLYSAIFLTGSLGSALLSRRATAAEARALGAIQVTFSGLVLLGIWLVDREVQVIDWGLVVNWAWVGAIALLGLIGLALIGYSRDTQARNIDERH